MKLNSPVSPPPGWQRDATVVEIAARLSGTLAPRQMGKKEWLLIVTALVVNGCDNGSTAGPSPMALTACQSWSEAYCDRKMACSNVEFLSIHGTREDCIRTSARDCSNSFTWPGVARTPTSIAACAEAIRARTSCTDANIGADICHFDPGTLPNGSRCMDAAQCASSFCRTLGPDSCGTCGDPSKLGEACQWNGHCSEGLVCMYNTADSGTCIATVNVGGKCIDKGVPGVCNELGFCNNAGDCQAFEGEGSPCTGVTQCDWQQGLTCEQETCRKVRYVSPGESCQLGDGLQASCAGGNCDLNRTCVGRAKVGEVCDPPRPPFCEVGLSCVGGHCRDNDPRNCK